MCQLLRLTSGQCFNCSHEYLCVTLDRVSVPSPIAIEILMDALARDRARMYLFSV